MANTTRRDTSPAAPGGKRTRPPSPGPQKGVRKGPRKSVKKGVNSNYFAIGAISLWVVVIFCAGGMILAVTTGWLNFSYFEPILIPTVPALPTLPPTNTPAEQLP
ncbi:MAG TPA: hypothetical protein PK530_23640, partial [Anaerolineales bacterium]|nr:hypothetical protein [Anaerolineales bacterium]